MKNLLGLTVLISLIAWGCKSDNCTPEKFTYRWTDVKTIDVVKDTASNHELYNMVDGNDLVFSYVRTGEVCEDVLDGDWSEVIRFRADKDASEFEYVDSNMAKAKCNFLYSSFSAHGIPQKVNKGTIKGRKLNSSEWEISLSIVTTPQAAEDTSRTFKFFQNFIQ
ncbi:MAG: hypothetical protein JJ975_04650 [Bacteroidia bacterium]|nr:hypothetical protein [Bacteroidia bacterium]